MGGGVFFGTGGGTAFGNGADLGPESDLSIFSILNCVCDVDLYTSVLLLLVVLLLP